MYKLKELIVVVIILIVFISLFGNNKQEGFRVDSQNYPYTNYNNIANYLEYGNRQTPKLYKNEDVLGPSSVSGVNQNGVADIFDNRGYNWSANSKDPRVDVFTNIVDNQQLQNNFERTYMLDPTGSLAQYDITNNKISANCCPAQYSPPFKLGENDSTNCEYAQKYVANQYSGMNYQDGYGCVCMTPEQADFYGTRGGNTE